MPVAAPFLRRWRLLPEDSTAAANLARQLGTSSVVGQLLIHRGLRDPQEAQRFLHPSLRHLHPAEDLPGVPQAVDRILQAIAQDKRICVYGDYDVDGITGTAILLKVLHLLGARRPHHYVPHRLEEGYGLNREALARLAKDDEVNLVITVDCGIASLAEAEEARRLGLELIITDHHEIKESLPAADVLVHPRLPGGNYPFGHLCGAGVALKLAWALARKHCGTERVSEPFREMLMDGVALAALGVVADVVPLHDENRVLVTAGLERLSDPDRSPLGVRVLMETAEMDMTRALTASQLGFQIAPRINAVGRLGQALMAVELLTTRQRQRAVDLARHCEEQNSARQKLERDTLQIARERLEEEGRAEDPALVLARSDWHPGVVGIVAGRLADRYARPTLLITLPKSGSREELAVGSGRSLHGIPLHEALRACDDLLVAHGGHAAAAGFRLDPGRIDEFRQRICSFVEGRQPAGAPAPELLIDAEVPLSAMTPSLLNHLDQLEPYGADNRKPLFLASGLQVVDEPRKVGKGERHLNFRLRQGNQVLKAIGWNMADRLEELMSSGGACSLVFTPRRNEWQGRVSVDLEVTDFQPGAEVRLS